MAGKIQNVDIKSEAELIALGATKSSLPNADKIYVPKTGITEILNTILRKNNDVAIVDPVVGNDSSQGYEVGSRWVNVTDDKAFTCVDNSVGAAIWIEGGAGGFGDADAINLISIDDIKLTDIDITGQNAAFDGGGTITVGALTISSSVNDLLKGETSLKYSPSANGQNDYWGFTQKIPLGYRGRNVGAQFEFKTSSTTLDNDFRFCMKIKDGTLAGDIKYFDIPKQDNNNVGKTFQAYKFLPEDCTELEYGFQNISTTTTVELIVDNLLITVNPFINFKLLDVQGYSIVQTAGALTNSSSEFQFNLATATINNDGESVITATDDYSNTRTKFIANKKCIVTIALGFVGDNDGVTPFIYKNGSIYQEGANPSFNGQETFVSTSMYLDVGDFFTGGYASGGNTSGTVRLNFTAQAEKESVVHVGDIEFQSYYHDDLASTLLSNPTGGKIEFNLANILESGNGVFEVTNVGSATRWTAKQNGIATLSIFTYSASAQYVLYIYKNGSNYLPGFQNGVSNYNNGMMAPVPFVAGDYFEFYQNSATASASKVYVSIVAQPSARTLITPTIQKCFLKDIKPFNTPGGTATTNVYVTKTLNTIEGDSSFVSLNSNEFTLGFGLHCIKVISPSYDTATHLARLWNVTDGVEAKIGSLTQPGTAGDVQTNSYILLWICLEKVTTFRVEHKVGSAGSTQDFGIISNMTGSSNSVFTQVEIDKYS